MRLLPELAAGFIISFQKSIAALWPRRRTGDSMMPVLNVTDCEDAFHFTHEECLDAGSNLRDSVASAQPFPIVGIEDFRAKDFLKPLLSQFPHRSGRSNFDRNQERFKCQLAACEVKGLALRNLLEQFTTHASVIPVSQGHH